MMDSLKLYMVAKRRMQVFGLKQIVLRLLQNLMGTLNKPQHKDAAKLRPCVGR